MKQRILCLLAVSLFSIWAHAQGVITVFSEDGDKFYLILNGVKQNPVAQTNVRVDGLTADYYNGKVVFEDPSKPEITKMMNIKDAATGNFAEVTFKIKKAKDGELKLRYFGMTPVPVSYNPPPDMYQAHYGQAPQAAPPAQSTVTQTTVTTTTAPSGMNVNAGAGGVSINMNMGAPDGSGNVNMNINMNDANVQTTTSQTTTTTTTSSSDYSQPQQQAAASPAGCTMPMAPGAFGSAKKSISSASFEDTKLSTAKAILSSNCLSTDQVAQICGLFSFEKTKLDFAKAAYSKTTDQSNYFKINNMLSFDASKKDLNNFIANGGQ